MARAAAALQRGRGAEAIEWLSEALASPGLRREDELGDPLRDGRGVAAARRRQPGGRRARPAARRHPRADLRPPRSPRCGACTAASPSMRGDQSRGIALLGRALKQAEQALDSRAIGLAHYELGVCYRQVGDPAIVREQVEQGDPRAERRRRSPLPRRRPLAARASSSAQSGRYDEAMAAMRQAEQLADGCTGRGRARAGLRQPGERRHDATPPRPGARARRARGLAARARRLASRPRRRARHARPDLRAARRPPARGGRAAPRARRAHARPAERNARRRVRHARADPPDSRRVRGGVARSSAGRRGVRDLRPAGQPLVRVVGPAADCAPRPAARAAQRRAAPRDARSRRRPACRPATSSRRNCSPSRRCSPRTRGEEAEQRLDPGQRAHSIRA